jgi:hypothetical protein
MPFRRRGELEALWRAHRLQDVSEAGSGRGLRCNARGTRARAASSTLAHAPTWRRPRRSNRAQRPCVGCARHGT